jgi:folate-dependent phosphoribosylglycinamide formyltransferase PurN/peptidoglycan/xylan/chitin deacetylase (PgdA/CDA1 family)
MPKQLRLVAFTSGPLSAVNGIFFERLAKEPLVEFTAIVVDEYTKPRRPLAVRIFRGMRSGGWSWLCFKLQSATEALIRKTALFLFEGVHPPTGPQKSYETFERNTGIPVHRVLDIHSEESLELIRSLRPDLGAIVGTRILRDSVLSIPASGTLNIHKRKVPEYRGGGPVGYWEVLAGESSIDVTIHFATSQLDAGPVLGQATIPIDPCDTLESLKIKADIRGAQLYHETIRAVARGTHQVMPQNPATGTTYRAPADWQVKKLERKLKRNAMVRMPSTPYLTSRFTWFRLLAQYVLLTPLLRRYRMRLIRGGRAPVCIFFYHVVSNRPVNHMCMPLEEFVRQIEFLRRYYRVVPLDEAVQRVRSEKSEEILAAITFDDGYADNAWAVEYLRYFEIPAAFFVSTGHMQEGRAFEHDRSRGFEEARPMTVAEVRRMASDGFVIGSHAIYHEDFGALNSDTAERVLRESQRVIRDVTEQVPEHFSFPIGEPRNIPPKSLALALRYYRFVYSAHGGYNFPCVDARYFLRVAIPVNLLELAMAMDGYTGVRRCITGDAWGLKSYALPRIEGNLGSGGPGAHLRGFHPFT